MLPRVLGYAIGLAGVSWIVDTLVRFTAPDLPGFVHGVLTAPQFAELVLIVYLLVRGVRGVGPWDSAPSRPAGVGLPSAMPPRTP